MGWLLQPRGLAVAAASSAATGASAAGVLGISVGPRGRRRCRRRFANPEPIQRARNPSRVAIAIVVVAAQAAQCSRHAHMGTLAWRQSVVRALEA